MAQNQQQQQNSKESKSGRPPGMRPRDAKRLTNRLTQNANSDPSWSGQSERMDIVEDVVKKQRRRPNFGDKRTPQQIENQKTRTVAGEYGKTQTRERVKWEPDPSSKLSTTETPPTEEPICPGVFRGSKPTGSMTSENYDFSMFPVLCRTVYRAMVKVEPYLPRKCPYPMFQHYCFMILNARIIDYQRVQNNHPDLYLYADLSESIRLQELLLPNVIFEYITMICNALTPSGEVIAWNLPSAAVPQGPIVVADETAGTELVVQSGSFGQPTAENHNVYECYASTFVSQMYIIQTIERQPQELDNDWNPFPENWLPKNVRMTENLLGYYAVEPTHREGIGLLEQCKFVNDSTLLGRISYSPEVTAITTNVLDTLKEKVNVVKCKFSEKDNSHSFIIKEFTDELNDLVCLSSRNVDLFSPYAFGSENANKAALMGVKRLRTEIAPGFCVVEADEEPIDGWLPHINDNYNMQNQFVPQPRFVVRESLHERNHEEIGNVGSVIDDYNDWLNVVLLKEQNVKRGFGK